MSEELRARMADFYGVDPSRVLGVRGTAHGAALLMRRLALDGSRKIAAAAPRWQEIASANGLDVAAAADAESGAIFLDSPDERTGDVTNPEELDRLKRGAPQALIVIDESLIDLTDSPSFAWDTDDRVAVLRSLDRAFGLDGDPCGAIIAAPRVVERLAPLLALDPLPAAVQRRALGALDPRMAPEFAERRRLAIRERARMCEALAQAGFSAAASVGPSVFVDVPDAAAAIRACRRHGAAAANCGANRVRVDVGAPELNDRALAAFGAAVSVQRRRAEMRRETLETKIYVAVDLDTEEPVSISTSIGFYDHMLAQIAAHGGFSLVLSCAGDTHVDAHHTIEDCAIALGAALSEALGARRGIARYGCVLPMDEAKAEAAIDLGGRPFLVFKGTFTASHIGQYPTEMTEHFFRSLAGSLGAAIHIQVTGENDHHKTEACFKAFARALRQAVRREGQALPSTKGVIL